jgi:hypothetical protein
MIGLLFEAFGGLALGRLVTAAVVRRYMHPASHRQHPMDMGVCYLGDISSMFQQVMSN